MLNGKKRFGWLAGLALAPVVGWGQQTRFITQPQNIAVCVGENAEFIAQAVVHTLIGNINWYINGLLYNSLPGYERDQIGVTVINVGVQQSILTFNYNETFHGIFVQARLPIDPVVSSRLAYLFYEPNHQSPVTGLTPIITNTTAQFYWNELASNFTTQYLLGVYDSDNNLIANRTTNTTQISYDLPRANGDCQYLTFKFTTDECPDPDGGFSQIEATTLVYAKPDVSPVTVQFDDKTVLVNWTPDGSNVFRIVVTDLESGEQSQTTHGTPPYAYTEKVCGKLNIAVSPAQCVDDPAFTHSTNISINCPTSSTQANYPSLLLTVAAVIPLLKWQH